MPPGGFGFSGHHEISVVAAEISGSARGMIIARSRRVAEVRHLLKSFPVVGLLSARQVGKSTLARQVAAASRGAVSYVDLEDPETLARLAEPQLALASLRGLVILDEIQRRPDLFPVLRVLADRRPLPARFLVLGSASPELLAQTSETLAGRIAYGEISGFDLSEILSQHGQRWWVRGGGPRSFLALCSEDCRWPRACAVSRHAHHGRPLRAPVLSQPELSIPRRPTGLS